MGVCMSIQKFNTLKYPSYCVLQPATADDQVACHESWLYCVRTRPDLLSTFKSMEHAFYTELKRMNLNNIGELKNSDFFIELISILIYHKKIDKLKCYVKQYDIGVLGQAMLIVLKDFYGPKEWTLALHNAWLRCFSGLVRALLKV